MTILQRPSAIPPPRWGRPQVGHIDFLNCFPLYWALERSGALRGIDLIQRPPAVLSEALTSGDLSVSPITLVEYLRHSADLLLLPGLAVAADGPVLSCNLVSRLPLRRLHGRHVGLGSTSRTTVLLTRFLLEDHLGIAPTYFDAEPDIDGMLRAGDAGVVIGDPGLRSYFHGGHLDGYEVHDTAELWKDWTGLPMVFAVWAVRRDYADSHRSTVAYLHRLLVEAFGQARRSLRLVARQAAARSSFTAEELRVYFRGLSHDLSPEALGGIRRFGELAAARGLIPAGQHLAMFDG